MIKLLLEMATIGMTGIFLQNLVLTQGIGTCEALKIANTTRGRITFGALVWYFSTFSALLIWPVDRLMGFEKTNIHARTLVFVILIVFLYLITAGTLGLFGKLTPRGVRKLAYAALNGIVVAVPFYNRAQAYDIWSSLAFGFCAGLGFMLALWLACEGLRRINSPDVPAAFRGLPIAFLYMGILSLAFFALEGKVYLP